MSTPETRLMGRRAEIGAIGRPAPGRPASAGGPAGSTSLFPRTGVGVWVGLVLAAGGFGLIAWTWGKVAALVEVHLQIPYVVSGGLVGLGLILVGLLSINLSVKGREALERQRQLEEIREAIVILRAAILESEEPS
jgi:hypothetical protein